jgi:hypothetical protein
LSEDTCRGLALLSRRLGLQGVGSTITSTLGLSVQKRILDVEVNERLTRRTWCYRSRPP